MPSPFPGMDPYLEGSEWRSVQTHLSVEIARFLAPRLQPKYIVRAQRESFQPFDSDDVSQVTLTIRDVATKSFVTAIELLTAFNKGEGHELYLSRRRRLLNSQVNLVEIDLLREGKPVLSVEPRLSGDYFVTLSRPKVQAKVCIYVASLRSRLPVIPVPLLPDDADVPLDLQDVLNTMYDAYGYDLDLDYMKAPEVELSLADMIWATEVLDQWKRNRHS
jgi:hypothetical protein